MKYSLLVTGLLVSLYSGVPGSAGAAQVETIATIAAADQALGTSAASRAVQSAIPTPQSAIAPMLARWFKPIKPVVSQGTNVEKIVYSTPAVYKIPQSTLATGFDIRSLRVMRGGHSVPALAVTSDGLILFGPGYADSYTDKDAIFLSATNAPTAASVTAPQVAPQASGLFSGPAATSSGAAVTVSYHDVYFDWALRPYNLPPWFSAQYLTDGSIQDFVVDVPNVTSSPAQLALNVWSVQGNDAVSPDHELQVSVNGQPAGQAAWGGVGQMLSLTFNVPAGALVSGANTIEVVTPELSGVPSQIALLHSISVRYTAALAGSNAVTVNASGAPQVYEVSGLSSGALWVVDTRLPDRATLVPYQSVGPQSDGTYTARFWGLPGGTGQYLVTVQGTEAAPLAVELRTLAPVKAAGQIALRGAAARGAAAGQWLAVGPSQFNVGSMTQLINARKAQGMGAQFVDQEQLFDYYNYGRYGPTGIRLACRAIRPLYLVLIGRTTYDYLNYQGGNVDPLAPTFLITTNYWAQATSDALYGDMGNGYPEVAVGRIPVNNVDDLNAAIPNILAHKAFAASGWTALAVADAADPAAGDFAQECDGVIAATPDITWSKDYYGVTYANVSDVTNAMTAAANGAANLILFVGHGNAVQFGKNLPAILDTNSVQNWTGDTIMLAATCTGAWIAKAADDYRSIPIQGMVQTPGGMAAFIGTSTYMSSQPAVTFMTQLITRAEASATWGMALMQTQQWAAQQGDPWSSDLAKTETILGDPAMPISGN